MESSGKANHQRCFLLTFLSEQCQPIGLSNINLITSTLFPQECIDLSGYRPYPHEVAALAHVLDRSTQVKATSQWQTVVWMTQELYTLLPTMTRLTDINLDQTMMPGSPIATLAKHIEGGKLKFLFLPSCHLSDKDAESIGTILSACERLTGLDTQ